MKKINRYLSIAAFILCSVQSLSALAIDNKTLSPISVTNAVVYVPLGTSKTTTAFFTIKNNSNDVVSITKVTTASAKKIDLIPAIPSVTQQKDAVSNPWSISSGQALILKPDRQYLQLTGLKNSLTTGDELQLEVSLSNGKKVIVIAQAKSAFDQIHGH